MSLEQLTPKGERMAYHAIRNILRGQHDNDVEDVLQQTRFAAHLHQDKFRGDSTYDTWFYRIAANQALIHKRQRKTEMQAIIRDASEAWPEFIDNGSLNEPLLERIASPGLNPEERMLALERNRQLTEAVLKLSPKTRAAVLRFAIGKHGDGAAMTNAEKSRKFRGMRKLRELLEGLL